MRASTNEAWLRWAVAKHFRDRGYRVNMRGVRIGNAIIDGEVVGGSWKLALEIKSGHDDVIRGIGQLVEALSNGYSSAALVTSARHARRLDKSVFRDSIVLLGVDSEARVTQIYP